MYDKPIYEGRLTLSEVFLEVRIITKKPTRPHSFDPHELGPNWYFLGGDDCGIGGNLHNADGVWCPRYCDPRGGIVSATLPHMVNGRISSFDLIKQWDGSGIKLFAKAVIGSAFVCWIANTPEEAA
jgi:hypothetical protein